MSETRHRISSALRFSTTISLCALLLLAGCPKTPIAGGPPPTKDEIPSLRHKVERLRLEAEELHKRQAESIWIGLTEREPIDLSSIYDEHPHLFSTESLRAVSRLRLGATDPDEQLALGLLESHFLVEHLNQITEELNDSLSAIEATATIEVEGHIVPYLDAGRLLAHEDDWYRRRAIHQSTLAVVDRLTPILRRKHELTGSSVRDLGYESLLTVLEHVRRADLASLSRLARGVLDDTEEIYLTALSRLAEDELGMNVDRMGWADIPRLFRGRDLDQHFEREDLMRTLTETLEGMGLTRDAGGRIFISASLEAAMRPTCVPVEVPEDIRLLVGRAEGLEGYRSLFREMGYAKRLAAVTERGFELRYLGDSAVAEAFALLFEGLLADPLWLSARFAPLDEDEPSNQNEPMEEDGRVDGVIDSVVRHQMLERLFLARRHAANVLFQLALASGDLDGHASPESLYAARMEEAYGFSVGSYESAMWAMDQDDFLVAADHLRGIVLQAQLAEQLVASYGDRWWKKPAAGAWMRQLWSAGAKLDSEDLAREAGADELNAGPLARQAASSLEATAPKE